jgi:hypothetical protein
MILNFLKKAKKVKKMKMMMMMMMNFLMPEMKKSRMNHHQENLNPQDKKEVI